MSALDPARRNAAVVSWAARATTLTNGTTTWDQNAVAAANEWNGVGAGFHFTSTSAGSSPIRAARKG